MNMHPWMMNTPRTKRNAAFKSLANMIATGELEIPVAGVHQLADFKNAVRAAETPGRLGKIVLKAS